MSFADFIYRMTEPIQAGVDPVTALRDGFAPPLLATRRQALLNCAAWNLEKAKKAEGVKDAKRAERLRLQAEALMRQAEEA